MRSNKVNEANKLYQYLKEVDELADWINEQIQVASSEEYGHDFEHLQVLLNISFIIWNRNNLFCDDGCGENFLKDFLIFSSVSTLHNFFVKIKLIDIFQLENLKRSRSFYKMSVNQFVTHVSIWIKFARDCV